MIGNALKEQDNLNLDTWELLTAYIMFADINEVNVLNLDQPFL